ncbi:MAG TPA: phosphate ABC transporter permease subunit PstC [Terriglobia bacterium]|nr:phosphate ABC transporter permease subunit PstC [Terriglobia bacterium]
MGTLVNSSARSARPEMPERALQAFLRKLKSGDEIAHLVTLLFALTILLITGLLFFELYVHSAASRQQFGWHFLVTSTWDPVSNQFGALPFVYGTVVTTVISLLMAIPLGIGGAIFLAEFAPTNVSDSLTFVVELLAAVPSVIYGLLGIFTVIPLLRDDVDPFLQARFGFLPIFQGPIYGVGFLAAGVVLAIMIVPFILSVSRQILLAVPSEQREAALSLGATRWEAIWKVVVPYARTGILGSIFLAMARALGETMAVTMVIGNTPQINASLFAPGYSIAAVIANEFTEATGRVYLHALIELGLVLFVLTIILNGLARILILATTQRGTAHT